MEPWGTQHWISVCSDQHRSMLYSLVMILATTALFILSITQISGKKSKSFIFKNPLVVAPIM